MSNSFLRITRQYISLTVDNETQAISGFTDLEIEATTQYVPRVIFLNARQMKIEKVTLGDTETNFEQIDTHSAFDLKNGPLIRDTQHFARIAHDVLTSPDLVIYVKAQFPLHAKIYFTVNQDSTAIVRKNGIIYTDNRMDGPSSWFPCIDSYGQRPLFTLDVTYHKDLVCVGFGKDSLRATDDAAETNTMRFHNPYPIQPKAVGFAIGEFSIIQANTQTDLQLTYYTRKEDESFRKTMQPVPELANEASDLFFDEDEYSAISIVHIPDLSEILYFPGLIFYPSCLVIPDGNINLFEKIIPIIIEALVGQLLFFLFPVTNPEDEWMQHGLIRYFADTILTKHYKESFRLDRRWHEIGLVATEDIHPSVVLEAIDPATGSAFKDEYLRVKAKLLINMIATSMSSRSTLSILMRSLLKESADGSVDLSKYFIIKVSPHCSQIRLADQFNKQWLRSNGIPVFTFNFQVYSRSHSMKFVLYQTPSVKTTKNPVFTGPMIVQLMDLEQPHESKFSVESQHLVHSLRYFAHKPKKKKLPFQFVNGTNETIDIYEAILWVLLDPQHNWPMQVRPRMPEFMVHNQLKLLRDVYVQHQALSSLEDWAQTSATQSILNDFLTNPKCYHGVRGHAARTLAMYAQPDEESSKHMRMLVEWYEHEFCDEKDKKPLPHNFQNLRRHLVQLEVIRALSIIRQNDGYTPPRVVELIQHIHNGSENSSNQYSDDFFQAECALALGRMNPENDVASKESETQLLQRVGGIQSDCGYCDILLSSRYTAITAIILKNIDIMTTPAPELIETHEMTVRSMRGIVLDESRALESKAACFRCLIFLSLYKFIVTFSELVSDLKILSSGSQKEAAAVCLREIYRFVLNTLPYGANDRFEGFLLCFPPGIDRKKAASIITGGPDAINIAETLWSILTVDAKHCAPLRSEALRAYTALYGSETPSCYFERDAKVVIPPEMYSTSWWDQTPFKQSPILLIDKKTPQQMAYHNQPPPGPFMPKYD